MWIENLSQNFTLSRPPTSKQNRTSFEERLFAKLEDNHDWIWSSDDLVHSTEHFEKQGEIPNNTWFVNQHLSLASQIVNQNWTACGATCVLRDLHNSALICLSARCLSVMFQGSWSLLKQSLDSSAMVVGKNSGKPVRCRPVQSTVSRLILRKLFL